MTDVRDIWRRLSVDGEICGGYVQLRIGAVSSCGAYAARDVAGGLKAFITVIRTSALPSSFDLPEAGGVRLATEAFEPGRSGRTRIVLALTDPVYENEFGVLVNDVVSRLSAATTESEAARILHRTFHRWLNFLRLHGKDRLSLEARLGLIGELLLLKRLLATTRAHGALEAWKGCEGSHHDFVLATGAIEAKATAATEPHSIRISNLNQLEPPAGKRLYVFHAHVLRTASGATSLPSLVSDVRSALPEALWTSLDETLMSCGYLVVHAKDYEGDRYEVLAQRFFEVGEGFPRVGRDDVPIGVEEVRYSVALAACVPFTVEESAVWRALDLLGSEIND